MGREFEKIALLDWLTVWTQLMLWTYRCGSTAEVVNPLFGKVLG